MLNNYHKQPNFTVTYYLTNDEHQRGIPGQKTRAAAEYVGERDDESQSRVLAEQP